MLLGRHPVSPPPRRRRRDALAWLTVCAAGSLRGKRFEQEIVAPVTALSVLPNPLGERRHAH